MCLRRLWSHKQLRHRHPAAVRCSLCWVWQRSGCCRPDRPAGFGWGLGMRRLCWCRINAPDTQRYRFFTVLHRICSDGEHCCSCSHVDDVWSHSLFNDICKMCVLSSCNRNSTTKVVHLRKTVIINTTLFVKLFTNIAILYTSLYIRYMCVTTMKVYFFTVKSTFFDTTFSIWHHSA